MNTSKFRAAAIDWLTWYRIFSAPVLLTLIWANHFEIFKWMLAISFFTDAIDGPLARRYRKASASGARLDSLGDDLTVFVAVFGLVRWNYGFFLEYWQWLLILSILLAFQLVLALVKFGKKPLSTPIWLKLPPCYRDFFCAGIF